MFTNYTNPFAFAPAFNAFANPFNPFAGFAPAWQPGAWSFTPGYNPSFQTPGNWAPTNFAPLNWAPAYGLNSAFCAPGCCPEFSSNNAWSATPYAGFAPSYTPGAWATPFAAFQNGAIPTASFATPWQGYTAQAPAGFNSTYAPATNPWNYTGATGAYNGVTAQAVPGGFPGATGVCRNAA